MTVLSYGDKNYQKKKSMYDVLAQVLEDLKYGTSHSVAGQNALHGGTAWNKPVQELEGVTMRLMNNEYLSLTHHRYETTTHEGLSHLPDGSDVLRELSKELKKGFKNYTGKALKLKEVKSDRNFENHQVVQADTSWMMGSSRYGYGGRGLSRYLIRDSCVYEFSAKLDE